MKFSSTLGTPCAIFTVAVGFAVLIAIGAKNCVNEFIAVGALIAPALFSRYFNARVTRIAQS